MIYYNIWSTWMGGFNSLRPSHAYMHQQPNHHWFRKLLVAWLRPSHYLNQCCNVVNWTLRNKLQWNFNQNILLKKMHLKVLFAKWWTFCVGLNVLSCSVKNTSPPSHPRQSDDTHSLDTWALDPCTSWYWTESDSTAWSLVLELISPISFGLNINSTAIEWY